MSNIFTLIALLTLSCLVLFQIALICKAPLGRYAWGGGSTVLPGRLRIASATSIILYIVFVVFLASKAGIVDLINNQQLVSTGMWVFTAYFFIGILMNALSRSKPERYLMTPVAAVLAISYLAVTVA